MLCTKILKFTKLNFDWANAKIDEYIVSIHPILLGQGIPLFSAPGPEESLKLIGCKSYPDGLVQLHYGDKEI